MRLGHLASLTLASLAMMSCTGDTGAGRDGQSSATSDSPQQATIEPRMTRAEEVSPAMRSCLRCHYSIVTAYLEHGMSRSVGPIGTPPVGTVSNPHNGNSYHLTANESGAWLTAKLPGGGARRQRLVGRIGAGVFDTSWVGAEVDVLTGEDTGRLFFAPVETVTGRGLELSPFELRSNSAGLDLALTEACLTCHTTDRLDRLPGAAAAVGSGARRKPIAPPNALGVDAFEHLSPITCEGCHGRTERHLEIVSRLSQGEESEGIGIERLGRLAPGRQRDICARCHLQGEVRLDFSRGSLRADLPLAGQVPVLVAARPSDDFRFVGQLERLALSACFRSSPAMTCTTCHRPHVGVEQQQIASFERACLQCHQVCSRPPSAEVTAVTGQAARGEAGCVDCHIRRSQPFDLPHVRSADHYIRRHIPLPESAIPHRQFADPEGTPVLFDDGRLAVELSTAAGRRWMEGVTGIGLVAMGRFEAALEKFDAFPVPGSRDARRPTAPRGVRALETQAALHVSRAMALLAAGRLEESLAAFSDALAVDPSDFSARMGRARLLFGRRDVAGALAETQWLIDRFPRAEEPWALRLRMAETLGRFDLATSALDAYTRAWPSDPVAWYKLGLLLRQENKEDRARQALAKARALMPTPPRGLLLESQSGEEISAR